MAQEALNEIDDDEIETLKRVLLANTDLAQRIDEEGMEVAYSPENDYVHLTIGTPEPSIAIDWPGEKYSVILIDPDSYRINAIEAPFFIEYLEDNKKHELWRFVASLIDQGRNVVYIPARSERDRAERAVQAVLPGLSRSG